MTVTSHKEITKGADPKSSPQARGRRLRSLRKMTDLSRKLMAEKYQLSAGTLQGWEDGRYGGLTEKGARKILPALRREGIQCNIEWIMHGVGMGPQISDTLYMKDEDKPAQHLDVDAIFNANTEEQYIKDELLLFRKHTPEAIDIQIPDNSMEPFYCAGDYVGGSRRFGEDISNLLNRDCIVQTAEGDTLLRRLKKGNDKNHFTLVSLNPNTSVTEPTLYNVALMSAAAVVWVRRREP